jgi:hypothetical protein
MALKLYRGVTYPSTYQHTNGNGTPLSLVGCTLFFTIKPVQYDDDVTDTTAVFKATVTSHTNAAAGQTAWNTLVPATGVDPGDGYYFDIVIRDATGIDLPPVIIGSCSILGKRTNRTS